MDIWVCYPEFGDGEIDIPEAAFSREDSASAWCRTQIDMSYRKITLDEFKNEVEDKERAEYERLKAKYGE